MKYVKNYNMQDLNSIIITSILKAIRYISNVQLACLKVTQTKHGILIKNGA